MLVHIQGASFHTSSVVCVTPVCFAGLIFNTDSKEWSQFQVCYPQPCSTTIAFTAALPPLAFEARTIPDTRDVATTDTPALLEETFSKAGNRYNL